MIITYTLILALYIGSPQEHYIILDRYLNWHQCMFSQREEEKRYEGQFGANRTEVYCEPNYQHYG